MSEKLITPQELNLPCEIPMPRRKDWRIGMIGFGGIAMTHAPAYKSAGWNIVAVADPSEEARKKASEATGAQKLYSDYRQLIADPEVEVISLLTQPALREEVVAVAAEYGKPIQTEKPFGSSLAACERMAALAQKAGIKLAVSQNYRWMNNNFYAYHLIQKGLIGAPYFASIEIHGGQDVGLKGHPFYSTCKDFLTLQWNNHLVDLLRYWLGCDAKRVLATTRRMKGQNFVSDNLLLSIADFGEGVTGNILHNELLRSPLGCSNGRIDGDEGSIVFSLFGERPLQFTSKKMGDELYTLDLSQINLASSFCGPMGDLLLSLEEGREPTVSAHRNLSTIRQVVAEDASARAGGVWVNC